jgi:hypothetical protein
MKLLFSIIAVFTMAFTQLNASNVNENKIIRPPKFSITYNGEIGIPERDCRGFGLGCLKGINILIEIDINEDRVSNANTVIFSKDNDKSMTLIFTSNDKTPGLDFEVDTDLMLDPKIATAYKNNSITILKGRYKVVKMANGQYTVTVPILVK